MKPARTVEQIDAEIEILRKERNIARIIPEAKVTMTFAYQRYAGGTISLTPTPVARIGDGDSAQYLIPKFEGHDEVALEHYICAEDFLKDWSFTVAR